MFVIKKREIRVGKENNPTERDGLRMEKKEKNIPCLLQFLYLP